MMPAEAPEEAGRRLRTRIVDLAKKILNVIAYYHHNFAEACQLRPDFSSTPSEDHQGDLGARLQGLYHRAASKTSWDRPRTPSSNSNDSGDVPEACRRESPGQKATSLSPAMPLSLLRKFKSSIVRNNGDNAKNMASTGHDDECLMSNASLSVADGTRVWRKTTR